MVSTRHHPRPFPEPALTQTRSSASVKSEEPDSPPPPPSPTTPAVTRSKSKASPTKRTSVSATTTSPSSSSKAVTTSAKRKQLASQDSYTHTPPPLFLVWLIISNILVFWDTGYVLLRPLTMPGGRLHSPIWKPYALYGTIDYMYGFPAWEANNGFTAAQASLNAIEVVMYFYYMVVVGRRVATGDGFIKGVVSKLALIARTGKQGEAIVIEGPGVASAVLLCFAGSVMTFSKTVLYALNEAHTGFSNVGHNSWTNLFWLWIVPNGAWLVFPVYMMWILGKEILDGMHAGALALREKKGLI